MPTEASPDRHTEVAANRTAEAAQGDCRSHDSGRSAHRGQR